jgi:hypothetical protein
MNAEPVLLLGYACEIQICQVRALAQTYIYALSASA